jgi:predicted nucleic acid-binding protein
MTDRVVMDASAAAAWVLPDEQSEPAEALLRLIMSRELDLLVPMIWYYEMLNLLVAATIRDRISAQEAHRGVVALKAVPVQAVPVDHESADRTVATALDLGLSVCDAAYVSLAETNGVPLLTADGDLLRLKEKRNWICTLPEFVQHRTA